MFQLKTYVVKDINEIEFIKCLYFSRLSRWFVCAFRYTILYVDFKYLFQVLFSSFGLKIKHIKIIIYFTLNIIASNYSIQYRGKIITSEPEIFL